MSSDTPDAPDPVTIIAEAMMVALAGVRTDVAASFKDLEVRVLSKATQTTAQTQMENPSLASTQMPKALQASEKALWQARKVMGETVMTGVTALLTFRRLQEETQALKAADDRHARDRDAKAISGLYVGAQQFVDRLFTHGTGKHHLDQQSADSVAIYADLIAWKAYDTQGDDPASPWPAIRRIYANRSLLKPDHRGNGAYRSQSGPPPPLPSPRTASRRDVDKYYRYGSTPTPAAEPINSAQRDGSPNDSGPVENHANKPNASAAQITTKSESGGIITGATTLCDGDRADVVREPSGPKISLAHVAPPNLAATLSTVLSPAVPRSSPLPGETGNGAELEAPMPLATAIAHLPTTVRTERPVVQQAASHLAKNEGASSSSAVGAHQEAPQTASTLMSMPLDAGQALPANQNGTDISPAMPKPEMPIPLTSEQAAIIATKLFDADDGAVSALWAGTGLNEDDLHNAFLDIDLRCFVDRGNATADQIALLKAAEVGQARKFVADFRRFKIALWTTDLLNGDPTLVSRAVGAGY
ncbi:hypothetical protein [Sphingomonas montana]|uniref:hypothetical protein n=1 Tax=Sphingomonas montana TaxID=1843236 RepID=UPI00101AE254|nr:hypothetical protein [Sphingomonas montana]